MCTHILNHCGVRGRLSKVYCEFQRRLASESHILVQFNKFLYLDCYTLRHNLFIIELAWSTNSPLHTFTSGLGRVHVRVGNLACVPGLTKGVSGQRSEVSAPQLQVSSFCTCAPVAGAGLVLYFCVRGNLFVFLGLFTVFFTIWGFYQFRSRSLGFSPSSLKLTDNSFTPTVGLISFSIVFIVYRLRHLAFDFFGSCESVCGTVDLPVVDFAHWFHSYILFVFCSEFAGSCDSIHQLGSSLSCGLLNCLPSYDCSPIRDNLVLQWVTTY